MLTSTINAWRISSGLAPAASARRVWLCTAPSARMAAAAASLNQLELPFIERQGAPRCLTYHFRGRHQLTMP